MPHISLRPGLSVFRFRRLLECDEILHFVSTRGGGQSPAPYASLNLSFRVGDDAQVVAANRQRLFAGLGISTGAAVAGKQVHGTRVKVVESAHRGRGSADWASAFDDTDALVTREPGICLLVLAADCVPVLVYDPRTRAVGAAHAGWRGTLADVVGEMVRTMEAAFGSRPSDLLAGIGPSIGPGEYEVGAEVIDQVRVAYGGAADSILASRQGQSPHQPATARLDLWTANVLRLQGAGVPKEQIEVAGVSSYLERERYFSERRDGAPTGRFGAGIMLRG